MKIFWVGNAYPEALENVFLEIKRSGQDGISYQALKEKVDASFVNYFATGWCKALANIGYETENVVINAMPLQRLWLKEHGDNRKSISQEEILLFQIKEYRPRIVFASDCCSAEFIHSVRREVPSVQLIIGWAGSAVAKDSTKQKLWKAVDIILCCAPESVSFLNRKGANAFHMNHAFSVDIMDALGKIAMQHSVISFIGSLVRGKEYHLFREKLLLEILDVVPLDIYSPSANIKKSSLLKSGATIAAYKVVQSFPEKTKDKVLSHFPLIGQLCSRKVCPVFPINFSLYRRLIPPVFGMEMFETLLHSDIVLNIHADSSPDFASNMRLYEATGVGSCLLTDGKKNMKELFDPGKEVVTYDSIQDCIEKAKWLIEHPAERKKIAEAGKQRCLCEHTYDNRAVEFDQIIKRVALC